MLEEFPHRPVQMIGVRAVVAAVLGPRAPMRVQVTPLAAAGELV